MKRNFILFATLFFIFFSFSIYPQVFIGGSFGACFSEMPSLRLFVNNYAQRDKEIDPFFSSPFFNFFLSYQLKSQDFIEAGLSSNFFSREINSAVLYNVAYQISKISIGWLKNLESDYGYYLLGGGAFSFNFSSLEIAYNPIRIANKYYNASLGLSAKVLFLAMLSDNSFVVINSSLNFDFNGEVKDENEKKLRNIIDKENVNLNSLNFQVSLGLAFKIN